MPAPAAGLTGGAPRRFRSLIPASTPRRGELAAAAGLLLLLAHLLFAQLTLVLAVAFLAVGRVTRWHWQWLAAPAIAGLVWTLAIGPGVAAAGFIAGPARIWAYLADAGSRPGRLLHLLAAYGGAAHWLPRQVPLALVAAAAEAGIAGWLSRPRGTGPDHSGYRPGLIAAVRSRWSAAALRTGGAVTRDGCGVGIESCSGRLAEICWPEAAGGVLAVGADAGCVVAASLPLARGAIRRRKSVVIIDLPGSTQIASSVTAACALADAPLGIASSAGTGRYEPFRGLPPEQAAWLLAAMIDWSGASARQRQAAEGFLSGALFVLAAMPPGPDTLTGLLSLLRPSDLRARMSLIPADGAGRETLGRRAAAAASLLEAEPVAGAILAAQLPRLGASALARGLWRAPARAAGPSAAAGAVPAAASAVPAAASAVPVIQLGRAVRDRQVVLFSLDQARHGSAAAMVARLVLADLTAVLRRLHERDLSGDSLVWLNGCEAASRPDLTSLLALAPATGTAVLLTTTQPAVAASLAPVARVILSAGPAGAELAAALAGSAGEGSGQQPTDLLMRQPEHSVTLIRRGADPSVLRWCRTVPATVGGPS